MLEAAILMAVEAHAGKVHRDGLPAVMHSMRVGLAQKTLDGMVLGFLHDIIEDCGSKWEVKIREVFGTNMAYKVSILTRRDGETYEEYGDRILQSGDFQCMFVKLADIQDNMDPQRSDEKARQKAVAYGRLYDRIEQNLRSRGLC